MLSQDATILDVCNSWVTSDERAQKEEYVRGVVGRMAACHRQHGEASVRIGVTGTGVIPNYRVEWGGAHPKIFGVFRSQGHGELVDEAALQRTTWSTKTASFADVQSLLGRLRGLIPRGA